MKNCDELSPVSNLWFKLTIYFNFLKGEFFNGVKPDMLIYKIFLKIDHNNNMKLYISGIADEISYFNMKLIIL